MSASHIRIYYFVFKNYWQYCCYVHVESGTGNNPGSILFGDLVVLIILNAGSASKHIL